VHRGAFAAVPVQLQELPVLGIFGRFQAEACRGAGDSAGRASSAGGRPGAAGIVDGDRDSRDASRCRIPRTAQAPTMRRSA
jgi:hypothetical protein